MFFAFFCFFFSKISFLNGVVFILYWELAFFDLSVFFSEILYNSHTNTQTNIYTHTHAHIRITLWEPNCVRNRNSYVCCFVTMIIN